MDKWGNSANLGWTAIVEPWRRRAACPPSSRPTSAAADHKKLWLFEIRSACPRGRTGGILVTHLEIFITLDTQQNSPKIHQIRVGTAEVGDACSRCHEPSSSNWKSSIGSIPRSQNCRITGSQNYGITGSQDHRITKYPELGGAHKRSRQWQGFSKPELCRSTDAVHISVTHNPDSRMTKSSPQSPDLIRHSLFPPLSYVSGADCSPKEAYFFHVSPSSVCGSSTPKAIKVSHFSMPRNFRRADGRIAFREDLVTLFQRP